MRKFEIHLNDEKIIADGIYTPEEVHNALDAAMESANIAKQSEGVYVGKRTPQDTDQFISMYFFLFNKKWFMDYVDKWLSYHDGIVDNVIEDIKRVDMRNR